MELVLGSFLLLCLLAAAILYWWALRLRVEAGIPLKARVVYSDTGTWKKVEKPLFARRIRVAGKPDYLVVENGAYVPIEVKPGRVAPEPLLSDTMQLMAYGLLVEENFKSRSNYGLLKYREKLFRVEFTEELRKQLMQILDEMRRDLGAGEVARSHADPRRCKYCGYRKECNQRLE